MCVCLTFDMIVKVFLVAQTYKSQSQSCTEGNSQGALLIVYGEDQGVDADGQSLRDSAGIVEAVCISVDPQASPGRERYTGGVCRVYRKVYRVAEAK